MKIGFVFMYIIRGIDYPFFLINNSNLKANLESINIEILDKSLINEPNLLFLYAFSLVFGTDP